VGRAGADDMTISLVGLLIIVLIVVLIIFVVRRV
jgi:hypothetical protein